MPRVSPYVFSLVLLLSGCASPGKDAPAPRTAAASARPARARQRYAVLLNGDTEKRHRDNVRKAYTTLRALGFPKDHIFVLTMPDRRRFPEDALRIEPAPDKFLGVLDRVGAEVAEGDTLVIYGTGHGDTSEGESFLELRNDDLWAWDLRNAIDRIRGDTVLIMDQCFSGGFAEALDGTKRRAIAVVTVDAQHETACEYFSNAFWNALVRPAQADRNHDGKVSVREAFEIALIAHREALADDETLSADGFCRSFNGMEDALLN